MGKVIHVSFMKMTAIVVIMMTTILKRTKCAVLVEEDMILLELREVQAATDRKVVKITQIVSLVKHVYLFSDMQENAKLFRRKRDDESKHLIFKKRFSCYVFV